MWSKLKSIFKSKDEESDKKKIENLVVLAIVIIVTIVAINYIWNDNKKENINSESSYKKLAESNTQTQETSSENLETKLENILSKIEGVGNVKVLITYSQTSQVIPMYDEDLTQTTTEENDASGGKRITNENSSRKEIIYEETGSGKTPITQSVVSGKIEGAVVTAEGAKNIEVKTNIIQAVEAVTGLSTHKIQVFEMNK